MSQLLMRGALAVVFGAGALLGTMSRAWGEEEKPVVLSPVSVVPDADFAKHPPLGAPSLSPDGQHIAVAVHSNVEGESKYQLAVLHLPDLKFVSRLDFLPHYLPIGITWVDNKRLVMGTGRETAFAEAPSPTGDVLAVDMDGKNKRLLFSDRMRGGSANMNILKIPPRSLTRKSKH
ncbi:MAG: hypothetical protein ABI846_15900 [Rudaea sp.]